ncbi:murein hydrolase activator EnvC family protein [Caldalkalibacillus salinus]|uniref:murein hydrolase activator EnvC family protein n=1 Tax=Caldalkalibacillus salinus TaxID=2803787 RepID=UPI0019209EDF|nr:M23 family metallopeptidase [Caldalkalibacillus salinus]
MVTRMRMTMAVVMSLTLVAGALFWDIGPQNVGQASSEEVERLEREIERLEQERRKADEQRAQVQGEIEELQRKRDQLNREILEIDQEMAETEIKISNKREEIATIETQAEEKAVELKEAEERVASQEDLLKTRVRAMYENGGAVNYLEVLLGAASFGEFIERLDMLSLLVQQDQKIIEDFIEEKETINEKKLVLEGILVDLEEQMDELDTLRASLRDKRKQKSVAIAEVDESEEELAKREAEMAQNAMQLANDISAKQKEIQTLQFDGVFAWPVPDSQRITSHFGLRTDPFTGASRGHNGMDVGAPQGTTIVAAADGIVIVAEYLRGYGNTVIIEHGDNTRTLYGHIRNGGIVVNSGQRVEKGQKIAEIGSTGRSTGPHLHFEVHENGQQVDPMNYLKNTN